MMLELVGKRLRRYRAEERGIAAVEFALVMPILFTLLLGGTEMARFILVHIKTEKMAYSVADVISQFESVTSGDVTMIFDATSELMSPYDSFGTNGRVILTSVRKEADEENQEVHWQCFDGGSMSATSHVGTVNAEATLPGGLQLEDGDNVIVSEVFYTYTPIINFMNIQGTQIYKTAMFRPRLGALTEVPGC
jgi:hypothetical protein